ncbi:hypothetical protein DNH61_05040 [Paenibacillus sambharensis]|uniref:Uncharacterized protein n=1 Tax=Paenibacillus sambharensis TaxID=1803190 RepID=A0A2W1LQU5_9BACL|nr:hypothetical protein [Paenibacillus sambharensis]PZD96884.1 hypothetical protein DNH61_05040 [Paenibacillus sambharensis]
MKKQQTTGRNMGHRSTTDTARVKERIAEADEHRNHVEQGLQCEEPQPVSNAITEAAKIGLHLAADPEEHH